MWLFSKHSNQSDEELISNYRLTGDKNSFASLFKNHVTVIYGTCLFYLQDKDEAKDAVMNIFEKLLTELKKEEIKNFQGWLSFVVRNHCISLIRKRKTHQKNTASYFEFEYQTPDLEEETNIHLVDDETMLLNLNDCLPKLKANQRICIELFYLKHLSYQQISTQTGYSISEIKSYIQNGKRNLKLMIEELQTLPRHE